MNVPPLSQAILLGIGAVKNYREGFLQHGENNCPQGCAIGTALFSVGHAETYWNEGNAIGLIQKIWPWTSRASKTNSSIACEISMRHHEGESRESIAAWIAIIEPAEPPMEAAVVEVEEVKA